MVHVHVRDDQGRCTWVRAGPLCVWVRWPAPLAECLFGAVCAVDAVLPRLPLSNRRIRSCTNKSWTDARVNLYRVNAGCSRVESLLWLVDCCGGLRGMAEALPPTLYALNPQWLS